MTHTKLEIRDASPNFKEILGSFIGNECYRTEWWQLVNISYEADKTKVGKDALKILKKSKGKFEGKYF